MTGPGRVIPVDVLRGGTIASMILVNNPGDWGHVYPPLLHAPWHGCTPTDLVFPFFLFLVGVSVELSLRRRIADDSQSRTLGRIFRRAVLLFAIGLLLNAFPFVRDFASFAWRDWHTLRIPGVLQRIAVCYLVAALLFLKCSHRTRLGWTGGLLLGYWALMTLLPWPDGGGSVDDKTHNLAAYLDRLVLGTHLWSGSKTFDPEGLLSTLPAVATTLIGVAAGRILNGSRAPAAKAAALALWGAALTAAGLVWSEGLGFPLNKSLWTSSYALFTAGLAMLALALCLWLVDVRGWRRAAFPFVVFGENALIVFVLSAVVARLLHAIRWRGEDGEWVTAKGALFAAGFRSWIADPHLASLAFAVVWVLGFFVLLLGMHRRGIVIKL